MANVPGTPGNDTLLGGAQDDLITGLEGNDTIFGFLGNDLIYGNQGNDFIDQASTEGTGNDTIFGGQGNDQIGNPNNLGADLIYGNLGDDILQGGSDNDTLVGGQGNDQIFGAGGHDLIYGNLGNDIIVGDDGNDTLFGGQDNDILNGASGNDFIYGNLGNDSIFGGDGNNTFFGGQGNDVLSELGSLDFNSDLMFGNLGADTFDFSALDASGANNATADRIGDFSTAQGDKIKIDVTGTMQFIAISNASVNSVDTAIAAALSANAFAANDVVFVTGPGTNGFLLVDQDGTGAFGSPTDFALVLENFTSLGASDIIAT